MSTPELRRIDDDSYPSFVKNLERTFGFDYDPDEDTLRPLLDLDRAFGHFVGEQAVSTLGAFSLEMTIPGNVVPCGGTTVVTVAPTHRRSGLLREMMDAHLGDVRDREEPIAALWASESEIYGRFGYGRATDSVEVTVHRRGLSLSRHTPEPRKARLIEPAEAKEAIPPFHDRFRLGQPGMFKRSEAWWEHRIFSDIESRRRGFTAARWAVVEGEDGIDGYARYRTKGVSGDDGHPASEMVIWKLFASSPEGWAGLWSYLLNHDLIVKFTAHLRPKDDPIFDILEGPRRAQARVNDGVWVRIMDVPDALEARSYQSEFSGVIKVYDPMELSGGTFKLDAGPEGSQCRPSDEDADIELDIEDLGAVYLGEPGFRRLARAGRIVGAGAVLKAADLAFGWDPRPWCPEIF